MKNITATLKNIVTISIPTAEEHIMLRNSYMMPRTNKNTWLSTDCGDCKQYASGNANMVILRGAEKYISMHVRYIMKNVPENAHNSYNEFFAYDRIWHYVGNGFAYTDLESNCSYNTAETFLNNMIEKGATAMEETDLICEYCGAVLGDEDYIITNDGSFFCNSDCAADKDYAQCQDCNEWFPIGEMNCVNDDFYVCDNCIESDKYHQCDDCNEYFTEDHIAGRLENGYPICEDCYVSGNYIACEECGVIVSSDASYYIDGSYYCENCADNHRATGLMSYHDERCDYSTKYLVDENGRQQTVYDTNELTMGFELEIDNGEDPDGLARWIHEEFENKIFCCHDGSLTCSGIEMISIPATLQWHMNYGHYDELLDKCFEHDYEDGASTAGLHVHCNRRFFGETEDEIKMNVSKLIILINKYWDKKIVPFTRRNIARLNEWASKNTFRIGDPTEFVRNVYEESRLNDSRYTAINILNYDTIEFRIFRSTLQYDTLIATLQFVDRMCRLAKTITVEQISNFIWDDVASMWNEEPLHTYLFNHTSSGEPEVFKFLKKKKKYRVKTVEEMEVSANETTDLNHAHMFVFNRYCLLSDWVDAGFGQLCFFDDETEHVTFLDGVVSPYRYDKEMLVEVDA